MLLIILLLNESKEVRFSRTIQLFFFRSSSSAGADMVSSFLSACFWTGMQKTVRLMVIHTTDCPQIGIDNNASDKPHSTLIQVCTDFIGKRGVGWQLLLCSVYCIHIKTKIISRNHNLLFVYHAFSLEKRRSPIESLTFCIHNTPVYNPSSTPIFCIFFRTWWTPRIRFFNLHFFLLFQWFTEYISEILPLLFLLCGLVLL